MTMDYSPWSEREISLFLNVAISPKPDKLCPPKLVYMCITLTPTCLNFLSRFQSIKFFDDHGLYSMVGKGNFAVFKSSNISETRQAMPTKFGVHECYINSYLHGFLEPIPIN